MNKTPVDKLNDLILSNFTEHPLMELKHRLAIAKKNVLKLRVNLIRQYGMCITHNMLLTKDGKCLDCHRNIIYYTRRRKKIPKYLIQRMERNISIKIASNK